MLKPQTITEKKSSFPSFAISSKATQILRPPKPKYSRQALINGENSAPGHQKNLSHAHSIFNPTGNFVSNLQATLAIPSTNT